MLDLYFFNLSLLIILFKSDKIITYEKNIFNNYNKQGDQTITTF